MLEYILIPPFLFFDIFLAIIHTILIILISQVFLRIFTLWNFFLSTDEIHRQKVLKMLEYILIPPFRFFDIFLDAIRTILTILIFQVFLRIFTLWNSNQPSSIARKKRENHKSIKFLESLIHFTPVSTSKNDWRRFERSSSAIGSVGKVGTKVLRQCSAYRFVLIGVSATQYDAANAAPRFMIFFPRRGRTREAFCNK